MEIWKTIEGYPDYQVSTYGRIKSLRFNKEKLLAISLDNLGYARVGLRNENGLKNKKVHRLVGETFLERIDGKNTVDHINHNRSDNHINNLRWATQSEQRLNSRPNCRSTNTGESHIHKQRNNYCVKIEKNFMMYRSCFKTLEEAVEYRDEILSTIEAEKTNQSLSSDDPTLSQLDPLTHHNNKDPE